MIKYTEGKARKLVLEELAFEIGDIVLNDKDSILELIKETKDSGNVSVLASASAIACFVIEKLIGTNRLIVKKEKK